MIAICRFVWGYQRAGKARIFFCYFDQSCNTKHRHLCLRLLLRTPFRFRNSFMSKAPKAKYRYGHVIAATCFVIQAVGIGTYFSYGVLFNPLIDEFGWSRAAISGAASMAFLLMGFLGIGAGRLNDRFGPRVLMTVSGVFFGLGYFLMSRLESIWQLYLFFAIIFGIGLSTVDIIALTTIARWFVRKRGIATGIAKVGTGAGQMTIPFLASILIIRYGWGFWLYLLPSLNCCGGTRARWAFRRMGMHPGQRAVRFWTLKALHCTRHYAPGSSGRFVLPCWRSSSAS